MADLPVAKSDMARRSRTLISPPARRRKSRDVIVGTMQGSIATGLGGFGIACFFIPHLPIAAAAVVCAVSLGAAAGQATQAHERLRWWAHYGDVFRINNFTYLHPGCGRFDDTAKRLHYAAQVRRPGTFAGFIEADALGHITGTKIVLYDRTSDCNLRQIARMGLSDDAGPSPVVRLVYFSRPTVCGLSCWKISDPSGGHFRALVAAPSPNDSLALREVDAGGAGDCLFLSVRVALLAQGLTCGNATAKELRSLTAAHIAATPSYNEAICSLSYNALHEYLTYHPLAKDLP